MKKYKLNSKAEGKSKVQVPSLLFLLASLSNSFKEDSNTVKNKCGMSLETVQFHCH